MADSYFLHIPL